MVLQRIYLTRHGFRANWAGQALNPRLDTWPAYPPDCPLSAHGVDQAQELCSWLSKLDEPIDMIFSSPFFRCVETIAPLAEQQNLKMSLEPGLGEWYGMYRGQADDPQPSSNDILSKFFSHIDSSYKRLVMPDHEGESIQQLYDRCLRTLRKIIALADSHESQPTTIVLCTHAATFVMLCRILANKPVDNPEDVDFIPWTAGITLFRRETLDEPELADSLINHSAASSDIGKWGCLIDGDCSFLSSGRERGWRFSGKESFTHTVPRHGVDAGSGLGVIVHDASRSIQP
ncbi:hypothetical protein FLONG3_5216 [Fusarium longipes]|uniref:Transcription factor n=1 Tax=Fusarium longipes TaxID=694270 RepID=A0A395SX83_9HYPO|nr:hypothetical protein FLONG3_5216 [Fusarium longipes]